MERSGLRAAHDGSGKSEPDKKTSYEAAEVSEELGENNPNVHKELLRNTVEIVTGICESVPEAMDDLRSTLGTARTIVRARGMELFCAGTHPFAKWSAQKLTDAPRYAELIYNGFWFSPEREMLQAAIDQSQKLVTGTVKLKLYKGNVSVVGRSSPSSLYDQDLVTFEEGKVAYDHRDAAGFIRLNALRLRTLAQRRKKLKLDN